MSRESQDTRVARPRLVVAVGASAGGLEAFKELLAALPPDRGFGFVLVQHLDPHHRSFLGELLAPSTTMAVREAVDGARLERDTVYVGPADAWVGIRNGCIELSTPDAASVRRPIDHLFRSLARDRGARGAAIVLSGAGSDGAEGLRAVKAAGGLTIAQTPEDSAHDGMPRSAIDTGAVDHVSSIAEIPEALERFVSARSDRATLDDRVAPPVEVDADFVRRLGAILHANAEFDLGIYKAKTIERRALRRMTLSGIADPDAYLDHVAASPVEQQTLVRDLLISVTEFFRDEEAFERLRTDAIEPLVRAKADGDIVRAWVAGCASGEEAYSIAMLLTEAIEDSGRALTLQVFATDVDADAIQVGRTGLYPDAIAARVGERRLRRFFVRLDGQGYKVRPRLRDHVSFAVHDLSRDPPFSGMDLVTCRNVLIYLKPEAQRWVLRSLHFALKADAIAFLGSSESIGSHRELYATLSKKWRIFWKVGTSRIPPISRRVPRPVAELDMAPESLAAASRRRRRRDLDEGTENARRAILGAVVPPTVVVGESGAVLYMHGELRPYLRFPEGDPHLDLTTIVAPELATRVRAALYRCRRSGETVVAVSSPDAARDARTRITARPARELGEQAVILTFEDLEDDETEPPSAPVESGADAFVEELERELLATREDLRHTVEELESSNEELRTSNEESTSMNEELQSANEELEATTEELRSLNEELTTVNVQLREKIEQLEHTHNDLTNFFASTKIATLFLDEGLRIARFTPATEELLRINHGDLGRYVGDIARTLLQNDLVTEAQEVLEHLVVRSRELRTESGRWVARRVLPYLTEDRRIEGIVVTFVDVTTTREATEALATREAQQAVIARLGLRALEDGDLESFLDHAVRVLRETLNADFTKILELQPGGEVFLFRAGAGWGAGLVGDRTVPNSVESQAGYTLTAQRPVIVDDLARETRFSGPPVLVEHEVVSGISCVISGEGRPYGVLGVHTTTQRAFTPEDANFVQAAAVIIGSAISRTCTRTRLAVESAAATSLNDASSMVDATARVHAAFESVFGPGASEVWVSDREGGHLERVALFSGAELDRERVEHLLAVDRRIAEEGLVPRIASSRRAEWVSSLQTARWFLRAEKARDLGLRSGVAIPIGNGRGLLGVMTFFTRQLLFADPVFLRSMESIGRMISEVTHRIEAEERYRTTVTGAPVGIGERALDGTWLSVNPQLCAITGRSPEALASATIADLTHPDDLDRERPLFESVRAGRSQGYALETRYVRPEGEVVWVNVSASLVPGHPGKAAYCVVVVEDISARKLTERDLLISEERFRRSVQWSPVPLLLHDDEGRILLVSASWTEITGYALEDIASREDWLRAAFPDRVDEMQALAGTLFEDDVAPVEYELDVRTKSGETRRLLFRAVFLGRGPDGRALRLVAAVDVTQQRRYERELVTASEQKDEFIAMLGHELRNPLAAVRSATELLTTAEPTRASVERVRSILARQTHQMAKLLDGLLDVSRIVRGKIELSKEIVDVTATVREVVEDHARDGMTEDIKIDVVGADAPIWVDGDPVRLTQIVGNVVTNATKYANDGGVVVSLAQDESNVTISVKDTGAGIEPELLDDLFQPFRQGPQSFDRSRGGLGIGLALVKRLVELHGGTVEAHSEGLGRGSEFVVRLPRSDATPSTTTTEDIVPAARRILIIEDNEDAAEMLKEALSLRGHDVYLALRGTTGIELAQKERPDVVLCDLGLPEGVTGFDVARALRADPRTQTLHLVALSGYARPEDRAKSEEAGFEAHLAKPVSIAEIERLVRSLDERG